MLSEKIAWVTGAGSGIGEAAAIRLAADGATVVLTGRREAPLREVAARIGERAHVLAADLGDAKAVEAAVAAILARHQRIDILVSNAGVNITEREWSRITPEGIDTLIRGNLSSAFYVARAVLPAMRAQKDGVMIHTASMAGRNVSPLSGPGYTAAKHAVVAMSHTINMVECRHGIRSTAFCPGEVNTPILKNRPNPLSAEQLAQMLQPEDCASLIAYVAALPPHVCMNEVWLTPTHNRGYLAQGERAL